VQRLSNNQFKISLQSLQPSPVEQEYTLSLRKGNYHAIRTTFQADSGNPIAQHVILRKVKCNEIDPAYFSAAYKGCCERIKPQSERFLELKKEIPAIIETLVNRASYLIAGNWYNRLPRDAAQDRPQA